MASNELIIGLGGFGGRSIAAFKRTMKVHRSDADLLRERGYRFEYLYIDSNDDILTSNIWSYAGEQYSLDEADIVNLRQTNSATPSSLEDVVNQDNVKLWMKEIIGQLMKRQGQDGANGRALVNMKGAGQLRRLGRALFASSADAVKTSLHNKFDSLQQGAETRDVNVRIFCTLGGGTGSGSLIDTITMLHSLGVPGELKVFVYPFVAASEATVSNSGSFFENEYAALRDLNALIVRRLTPHLVAPGEETGSKFDPGSAAGGTPIKSVYISSGLAPGAPSHKKQIKNMAEACFDAIIYSNTYQEPDCLRALTGEDIVDTNPGEPSKDPVRSYRFAALGGKKWCLPIELIRELLVDEQKERIFNAHLKGTGKTVSDRDASRIKFPNLSDVLQDSEGHVYKTGAALREKVDGCKRAFSETDWEKKDTPLLAIHEKVDEIVGGISALCAQSKIRNDFSDHRRNDVSSMMEMVYAETDKVIQWSAQASEAWGIEDVAKFLTKYKGVVSSWRNIYPDENEIASKKEKIMRVMEKREKEWEKIGVMTQLLTSKASTMIRDHIEDSCSLIALYFYRFQRDIIEKLSEDYIIELSAFMRRINLLIIDLKKLSDEASDAKGAAYDELQGTNTPGRDALNSMGDLYEFDDDNLRKLREKIGSEKDKFAEQMEELCQKDWPGTVGSLKDYESKRLTAYAQKISPNVFSKVQALDELARTHNPELKNVLVNSIIEYLNEQYGQTEDEWERNLGEKVRRFVKNMRCSTDIKPVKGLVTPRPAPIKAFVVGFPEKDNGSRLVNWLKAKIIASIPADFRPLPGRLDYYTHKTNEELRLLYMPYWFPARFAPVVDFVYDKYKTAAKNNKDESIVYFANLDDDDIGLDSVTRPPLTLKGLPDEEMQFKVNLCKSLFVHSKAEGGRSALLRENGEGQQRKIHVLHGLTMGRPDYGTPFVADEASYPGEKFKSTVDRALKMAQESMTQEEKAAVFVQYEKKYDELAAMRSEEDPAVQEALQDMKKVKDMLSL